MLHINPDLVIDANSRQLWGGRFPPDDAIHPALVDFLSFGTPAPRFFTGQRYIQFRATPAVFDDVVERLMDPGLDDYAVAGAKITEYLMPAWAMALRAKLDAANDDLRSNPGTAANTLRFAESPSSVTISRETRRALFDALCYTMTMIARDKHHEAAMIMDAFSGNRKALMRVLPVEKIVPGSKKLPWTLVSVAGFIVNAPTLGRVPAGLNDMPVVRAFTDAGLLRHMSLDDPDKKTHGFAEREIAGAHALIELLGVLDTDPKERGRVQRAFLRGYRTRAVAGAVGLNLARCALTAFRSDGAVLRDYLGYPATEEVDAIHKVGAHLRNYARSGQSAGTILTEITREFSLKPHEARRFVARLALCESVYSALLDALSAATILPYYSAPDELDPAARAILPKLMK